MNVKHNFVKNKNEKDLTNTNLISLISGGIDSPAASHLFLKKGINLTTIYFDNQTYIKENKKEKALKSIKILSNHHNKPIKTYIIPHDPIITEFIENISDKDKRYTCIFCRRMMLRIAEKVAKKEKAEAIVTGESLGQVASQTLDNIGITSKATNIPVLRPLLGLDKEEIIEKIAKKIKTFQVTSGGSSCQAVPDKPEVFGNESRIKRIEEESIPNLNSLIDESIEKAEIKKIDPD